MPDLKIDMIINSAKGIMSVLIIVNKIMVYDSETFQNLHNLTEEGLENYRNMLEKEADRILFKHQHPFAYWWQKFKELFS